MPCGRAVIVNQIVVMDEGRIAEAGSHAELVGKPGFYRQIFKNQALAREMVVAGKGVGAYTVDEITNAINERTQQIKG